MTASLPTYGGHETQSVLCPSGTWTEPLRAPLPDSLPETSSPTPPSTSSPTPARRPLVGTPPSHHTLQPPQPPPKCQVRTNRHQPAWLPVRIPLCFDAQHWG
eukprot:350296-Chlamydomonas_euryale.AAC.4